MADTKGDCFIIMPITTPDNLVDLYDEDESHFEKVLKHLFTVSPQPSAGGRRSTACDHMPPREPG